MVLLLEPDRQLSDLNDFFRSVIFYLVKAILTVRSNPRMIVLIAMVMASIIGSLLITFLVHTVLGLVTLAISSYIAYHILKFVAKQLTSYIAADKSGITIYRDGEKTHGFAWHDITFTGHAYAHDGDELIYFYIESSDRLFTISPEFENFQLLRGYLSCYISTTDIELSAGESLSERLRQLIAS